MRRPILSDFAYELLENEEYLRFFMLAYHASIDRDPITATRDYLFEHAAALAPNPTLLPDGIRSVFLRRITYGKSLLEPSEIDIILNSLGQPDDKIISAARELVLDHLSLSDSPPRDVLPILERLFTALDKPRRKGRSATYNNGRNYIISTAVRRLVAAGLYKTGVGGSACDIVGAELCRMGHPISADGVRKIVDAFSVEAVSSEEVEMVRHVLRQDTSDKLEAKREESWRFLSELGKKLGYIHSNDQT